MSDSSDQSYYVSKQQACVYKLISKPIFLQYKPIFNL